MAKLNHTSESLIHVGIAVLNLDKWLAELFLRLFQALQRITCAASGGMVRHLAVIPQQKCLRVQLLAS